MKKLIAAALIIAVMLTLCACSLVSNAPIIKNNGQPGEDTPSQGLEIDYHPVYGQDPLAIIPGSYTSIDNKATATVKLLERGGVNVTINIDNGAGKYTEWSLTGELDNDLTITFSDDVMKIVTLDQNNVILNEEVKYTDGYGTVGFDEDAVKFTWLDVKSETEPITFKQDKK